MNGIHEVAGSIPAISTHSPLATPPPDMGPTPTARGRPVASYLRGRRTHAGRLPARQAARRFVIAQRPW